MTCAVRNSARMTISQNVYMMRHIEFFQAVVHLNGEALRAGLPQSETLLEKIEGGLYRLFPITQAGWNARDDISVNRELLDRVNDYVRAALCKHDVHASGAEIDYFPTDTESDGRRLKSWRTRLKVKLKELSANHVAFFFVITAASFHTNGTDNGAIHPG